MLTVNALRIRNQLGEVLNHLEDTGEPILVSKGREIRAVLISLEDFQTRFVDKLAEEEAERVFQRIVKDRAHRFTEKDPETVLRQIRGYKD